MTQSQLPDQRNVTREWTQFFPLNTQMLVKKGFQRMLILHKLYSFKVHTSYLVKIYILYIRSILEQSCVTWHFSLTEDVLILPRDLSSIAKLRICSPLTWRPETRTNSMCNLQELPDCGTAQYHNSRDYLMLTPTNEVQ